MATAIGGTSWTDKRGGTKVGSAPDGSAVDVYVLKHEGIDAAIMTYGARLISLRTPDRYGRMADVVMHCHRQLHMDFGFMQLIRYTG